MKTLLERFKGIVNGTLSGFDRIAFKGFLMPLMYAKGVMDFCRSNGILNKDYKKWMQKQTKCLVENANQYGIEQCGSGIMKIPTWRIRKEELVHKHQKEKNIEQGLIGVWSCLESGTSYRATFCPKVGYPQLERYPTRCKHLYFYFDHSEFGFMNIRLQTWFPYHIQVCLNGREWLRRSLEQEKLNFVVHGNKFLHISDYEKAQQFLNSQLDARFTDLLNGFIPDVFPAMNEILGPHLSYYWTMWQSEWATDLIFDSPKALMPLMNSLLCHAHLTGTSTRVLRYMDRPLTLANQPFANSNDDVLTRVKSFNDGIRVRHWVDNNSVKFYNEQNVLRVETTINNPGKFKVFRHKQGQSTDEAKSRLPLRKGVMDIPLRANISQQVNDRFMNDLASYQDISPVSELIENISQKVRKGNKPFRALDLTGKDRKFLQLLCDPQFRISGITNKALQHKLWNTDYRSRRSQKQLSAKISRHFQLLRAHGIIKKLPNQNQYQLTAKGVSLTNILNAFLQASTENLINLAA